MVFGASRGQDAAAAVDDGELVGAGGQSSPVHEGI